MRSEPIDNSPIMTPRPHQAEAIAAVADELGQAARATLVMACGTGKTAVGVWVAAEIVGDSSAKSILCLFPSLALIRQTIPVWQELQPWGNAYRFQAVCSDESVVDEDDFRPEDMPFPITTDSVEIERFIRGPGVKVIFATYHSSLAVASAVAAAGITIELALFDEAHKTTGRSAASFSAALSDATMPCCKRLFMTATPRVTNRRKRDKEGEAQVVSMDDERIYGRVAYRLSFREAARRGIICRYKVLISTVTSSELGAAPGAVFVDVGGRRMPLEDAAVQVALAKAAQKFDVRKIITFHATVAKARDFVGAGGIGHQLPEFETYHVNGAQLADDRDRAMGAFARSPKGLISNARCLTEGVDIPAVDLVGFISRKTSKIDIVQAVGRALRKPANSGKKVGYVLLPLLIDDEAGENIEAAVARAGQNVMWDVLTGLMDEDELLAEAVSVSRQSEARTGSLGSGSLDDFIEVIGDTVDIEGVRRAVSVSVVHELARASDYGLGKMQKFVSRVGHACVPVRHVEGGFNLGTWVSTCRKSYRKGTLPADLRAILEALPGWSWDPFGDQARAGLAVLQAFVARVGHARVPVRHVEGGFNLGIWVSTCRKSYRKGTLPADLRATLEALPGWGWDPEGDQARAGLAAFQSFVARVGHTRVPVRHVEDGVYLDTWAHNCRTSYRKGTLPADLRATLEALPGWTWDPEGDQARAGLAAFQSFVARVGHARVPKGHVEGGINLFYWAHNRRRSYRKGTLSADLRAALEALPGWTWGVRRG